MNMLLEYTNLITRTPADGIVKLDLFLFGRKQRKLRIMYNVTGKRFRELGLVLSVEINTPDAYASM